MSEAMEAVEQFVETAETKQAEAAIMARLADWAMFDGPRSAWFGYRRRQGADGRVMYYTWTYGGRESDAAGASARTAELISSWFPEALMGAALADGVAPEAYEIWWRARPEVRHDQKSGRFRFYCRVGFKPKDAWLLEPIEQDA